MGFPIRSGYPNKDHTLQPVPTGERGGIYDREPGVSACVHQSVRYEFLTPSVVIFSKDNRGQKRRAVAPLRFVHRCRK